MIILRSVIENILNQGFVMSVLDDEGLLLKGSSSAQDVVNTINDVEECYVRIWDLRKPKGHEERKRGALFIVDGEVSDYTSNKFMNSHFGNIDFGII